jgi:glycosyltransferase involved in cell wall biosynthesis
MLNITHINNRYNNAVFINNPKKESNISIIYNYESKKTPFFSIIMPIYNQESIIVKNIISIFNFTKGKEYELILILDACNDATENKLMTYLKMKSKKGYPDLLTNIVILKSSIPLFETAADNLGFFCSRGKYLLEIQADMEMTEDAYNMKLLEPFEKMDNVIGVSGRCGHQIYNDGIGIGKLGMLVELPLGSNINKNSFYITETCNRGPLLLDADKLRTMGYLDETNYYLDNSDHDLFARSYVKNNFICGYRPIEYLSPISCGSTRKPRDQLNEHYYRQMRQIRSNGFYEHYKMTNYPVRPIVEIDLASQN